MANTVKVRIAVAVDEYGQAHAFGFANRLQNCGPQYDLKVIEEVRYKDCRGQIIHWIEADLPIPEIQTIQAKVSDAQG